jgi:hypothetical protein
LLPALCLLIVSSSKGQMSLDSIPTPFRTVGATMLGTDSSQTLCIDKQQRRHLLYASMSEILYKGFQQQPLWQGGFAQHNGISMFGGTQYELAVTMDNRPVVNPMFSAPYLELLSVEGTEELRLLSGSSAIASGSSGGAFTLQQQSITYNTAKPYLAMWYAQGGGDFVAMDGVFAQNIARGVNVNVGVRRAGANGVVQRTVFDTWNVRASTRLFFSDDWNAVIRYELTSANTEINGGVLGSALQSASSLPTLPVLLSGAEDQTRMHDIQAAFQWNIPRLFGELHATMWHTSSNLLRFTDTLARVFPSVPPRFQTSASTTGTNVEYRTEISQTALSFGAMGYTNQLWSNPVHPDATWQTAVLYAAVKRTFDSSLVSAVQFAARTSFDHGYTTTSLGGMIEANVAQGRAWLDVSRQQLIPSVLLELQMPESHVIAQLGYKSKQTYVVGWLRAVTHALLVSAQRDSLQRITRLDFSSTPSEQRAGLYARTGITWGSWTLQPWLRIQTTTSRELLIVPEYSAGAAMWFTYTVGKSRLELGIDAYAQSAFTPTQWEPNYRIAVPGIQPQSATWNGSNAFLRALVGDAVVRVGFENIFGTRQVTTAAMVDVPQNIRLSVTWAFPD